MGHELRPRNGKRLSVAEIERCLRAEFSYVEADFEDGTRRARERAGRIEARPPSFFNNANERIAARRRSLLARARELRALPAGAAARFRFGDEPRVAVLDFVFIPGDAIIFGYGGADEEARLRPMVDRCARALDADVVLF